MTTLAKIFAGIGTVALIVAGVALVLSVAWVLALFVGWLGLNVIAGFGLSFAQLAGIALVVAFAGANAGSTIS